MLDGDGSAGRTTGGGEGGGGAMEGFGPFVLRRRRFGGEAGAGGGSGTWLPVTGEEGINAGGLASMALSSSEVNAQRYWTKGRLRISNEGRESAVELHSTARDLGGKGEEGRETMGT